MQGDAQRLPYPADAFDAAYLTAALGVIPDRDLALGELRRVVKDGGRLVVGEMMFDSDYVSQTVLVRSAARAGFAFERFEGPRIAYFARFS